MRLELSNHLFQPFGLEEGELLIAITAVEVAEQMPWQGSAALFAADRDRMGEKAVQLLRASDPQDLRALLELEDPSGQVPPDESLRAGDQISAIHRSMPATVIRRPSWSETAGSHPRTSRARRLSAISS